MFSVVKPRAGGFTLIELVIGMALVGASVALLSALIFPLFERSVEPVQQMRAAKFAQAILDDVMSRRYDQETPIGGKPACTTCTAALGAEAGETSRANFNDVDDYNIYCGGRFPIEDIFGSNTAAAGYEFSLCVDYDGNFDGVADTNTNAKKISLTVFLPASNDGISFTSYRGNY